mgnify:CR=1 FL=1
MCCRLCWPAYALDTLRDADAHASPLIGPRSGSGRVPAAPATAIAAAPSAPAGRYLTTQDLDIVRKSLATRMAVESQGQQQQKQQQ